jgi:hypothetical protein
VTVRALGRRRCKRPFVQRQVRPEPTQPMAQYVEQFREDGLPVDPWLRVHVQAGGKIVKVAPTSMVMAGSLAEWR